MGLEIIKTIGQGGFGRVDEVVDEATGIHYALKTFAVNQGPNFPPDLLDNVRRRFQREASMQAAIEHRNVVPVLAQYLDVEPPSFLMPLAASSLSQDLSRDRTLDGRWLEALMDIISGLEMIHKLGIYHRDLKPDNVLRLTGEDSDYYAIGDFGLMSMHATQVSVLTQTGMQKGSDFYTAPEIVRDLRRASARSDIFSLGCILHDMVGREERVPLQPIREDGPFGGILAACTRPEPERRFGTVGALRDALVAVGPGQEAASTGAAASVLALLDEERPLTEREWREIANFFDDSAGTPDRALAFRRLSLPRIKEVLDSFPEIGKIIGLTYGTWVRDNAFPFSECDAIANRLEAFIRHGPIEVQAECIMSMLYMGTSHNRWYVEGKFMELCGAAMDELLAMRVAIEMRTDGLKACAAINHLEHSLGTSREQLVPLLQQTLQDIC